ncbi:MAG TPA: rRNA maturation RNase YbeY [Candidatus Colwellbacteria bacterium]|nr:rRNA maturation RNase YbeY [Candidatus Colwellbacteria bacterium]HQA96074.1 rRNA maturation RNase YbeY [Candidatus Colwellbacteria bacterium]
MALEKRLQSLAEEALILMRRPDTSVSVYLISDSLMRELNFKYRRKDKPTTVLSFIEPQIPHPETDKKVLGEIYLAPRYIEKNKEDIDRLLIHGLLHLLGYDHTRKDDKIKMENKERDLARRLLEP